ncbi:MAG: hypothetical protein QOE70_6201 [Chthoniobacter sp.]|jgi:hypothetical protein|nr:hypothetical protein [Chthoniobacter sp.]
MKTFRFLAVLLTVALSSFAVAADPEDPAYWYKIAIQSPGGTTSFVGTSRFTPETMGDAVLATATLLKLENLRMLANTDGTAFRWQPDSEAVRVFIVPKTILYFYELQGDPMLQER